MKYIDSEKLKAEIERRKKAIHATIFNKEYDELIKFITSLQQEQPEADLKEEAYMHGFAQGAKEERKDLTPLINRLCEAILFEWKDAADLARKTLTQIKAREEEWHEKV